MTTGVISVGNRTSHILILFIKNTETATEISGYTITFEDGKSLSIIGTWDVDNTSIIPKYVFDIKII